MRRALSIVLAALLLCGFTRKSFELPENVYLTCKPPLDRSDRDPVVETLVSAEFDKRFNSITTFNVTHRLYYGKIVDRTDQYDAELRDKKGYYEWYWVGDYKKNRRLKMIGTLFYSAKWHYREELFQNDRHVVSTPFDCTESEGE